MKYLKFYEAFNSKGISKTIKFLKSKVGKKESTKFVADLKKFMAYTDFPIDTISDDYIKYMRAKSALDIKSPEEVSNDREIWALKFWFSMEKGYLGFTGIGNEKYNYESKSQSQVRPDKFTTREIDFMKDTVGMKGEIWPVTDYDKLKTGDKVCGFFGERHNSRFDTGIVFLDNGERGYYILQNVAIGYNPSDGNYRSYDKRFSWWIYTIETQEVGTDHYCLHYYNPTSEDLHYVDQPKEEKEEEKKENPLDWNLPLDGLNFNKWNSYYDSILKEDSLKEADFSIILYYDDMLNPEKDAPYFEPVSGVKKGRVEDKKGTLALMKDEDIKKQNIERYISKIPNDIQISKDDLSNLGRIAVKSILSIFSYFYLYRRPDNLNRLEHICRYFYNMMSNPELEVDSISSIKSCYLQMNNNYYYFLYTVSDREKKFKGTRFEEPFNKMIEIGNLISKKIKDKNAQSIDDLLIIYYKLMSIRNLIHDDINAPSYELRCVIDSFFNTYDYHIDNDDYTEESKRKDLEKLERVKKYVNSTL